MQRNPGYRHIAAYLIILSPVILLFYALTGFRQAVMLPLVFAGLFFIAVQKIPLVNRLYLLLVTAVPFLFLVYRLVKAVVIFIQIPELGHILFVPAISVLLLLTLAIYIMLHFFLAHLREVRKAK